MADNNPPENMFEEPKKGPKKYFRTRIAGLSILTDEPADGEVAPETVRFTPIWERYEGEQQRFGYLETDNAVAVEKCLADPNVEEISADEYKKMLKKADDANDVNTKRAAL